MKSTLRLNAKVFPLIALTALIMQIVDPSRVWMILLISLGGIWLVCRWWVRGLQRSLAFEREMRFGWAQVGDRLEERFLGIKKTILLVKGACGTNLQTDLSGMSSITYKP